MLVRIALGSLNAAATTASALIRGSKRAVPEGVATAKADADASNPCGVDGLVSGEETGGSAQVGELAGAVLVLAHRSAAGTEVAVVERECGEAALGEQLGVVPGHLLFDPSERTGEDESGQRTTPIRWQPEVSGNLDAAGIKGDVDRQAHVARSAFNVATTRSMLSSIKNRSLPSATSSSILALESAP